MKIIFKGMHSHLHTFRSVTMITQVVPIIGSWVKQTNFHQKVVQKVT